ncbi:ATP-binding protein [Mucilaginibacter calamicampi]|uniref:histidine kinase n=1 Tax=Mucilaginibacter calamicampi TaxID=1302352 RepID=A0ABW2Z260_9SPHI
MLLLLAGSLLLTALIVHRTYTPDASMRESAKELESNLHKKEAYIYAFIGNKPDFNSLKNLGQNEKGGLKLINQFTTEKDIRFVTVKNGTVEFWSGVEVIPQKPSRIKEGVSFIKESNGYYEAIKKTEGNFSVLFFIPIKTTYEFQNRYLQNTFAPGLVDEKNIEIADFTDKNVYPVRNVNKVYLFSVKAKPGEVNSRLYYGEVVLWLLTFIVMSIFMQNTCNYLARTGFPVIALILLAVFIIGIRGVNLYYNWPNCTFNIGLFNPKLFSAGPVFPSIGDLCINILCLNWYVVFLYQLRHKLLKFIPDNFSSYALLTGCFTLLIITSTALYHLFYDLVIRSAISFDVSNVLNLSIFSVYGLLMLCFSFLIFSLLIEIAISICVQLPIPRKHQLIFLISGACVCTIAWALQYHQFTLFYFLWAGIAIARGYAHFYHQGKLNYRSLAVIIFICSFISALSLTKFEKEKEGITRRMLIKKLETPDDATADTLFRKIENKIVADPIVIDFFSASHPDNDHIKNYFQKRYFDDYLSKYDLTIHAYDTAGQPIDGDKSYPFETFTDLVQYSSFKVSNFFYRQQGIGVLDYFAILPIAKNGESIGVIVARLGANTFYSGDYFPALLAAGTFTGDNDFKNYSYALYSDNKLSSQSGPYVYNLKNDTLSGFNTGSSNENEQTTTSINNTWYNPIDSYSHFVYKPKARDLIVVSKEERPLFNIITSLTFFFIILLVFSLVVMLSVWAWTRVKFLTITNDKIKWGLRLNFDKVLYKTRIQLSMVSAVVITLLLVGAVTYASISTQYQSQQDKMIRDKIVRITSTIENALNDFVYNTNEEKQIALDGLAESYATDLTIFKQNGHVEVTTRPRIYEAGLVADRMDPRAFIHLNKLQRSEYINEETIGQLKYKAVYAPIRDNVKNETAAYLQLPYFANELDYRERIGALLNVMINIYAFIFIAIGFFAVIIARQITYPLNFIQQSLSKTIYGQKTEPIIWKRDDEIGTLISEYNKMIAALEQSAQKLAQSERESAWREMAKQVAHEIKNPLTPLKLGLQLLEKSWREKDARFDQKFERFSKSFVEQIESLASIASEFSAFAKMPDTRMSKFNIFDVLSQAVVIFKQMDNFTIGYSVPEEPFIVFADRDQLLRCFNNLLKNSIEATPPDRPGFVEINYETSDKNILFMIKDNGNGIPENMREKIFEPNFTTKSSGTGLGLAFVKNSIENAGGKVWFETKTGQGTTFYLNFPIAT